MHMFVTTHLSRVGERVRGGRRCRALSMEGHIWKIRNRPDSSVLSESSSTRKLPEFANIVEINGTRQCSDHGPTDSNYETSAGASRVNQHGLSGMQQGRPILAQSNLQFNLDQRAHRQVSDAALASNAKLCRNRVGTLCDAILIRLV